MRARIAFRLAMLTGALVVLLALGFALLQEAVRLDGPSVRHTDRAPTLR